MRSENSLPSVSYTHLDVYKRQVTYQTNLCRIFESLYLPYPLLELLEVGSTLLRGKGKLVLEGRAHFNTYSQSVSYFFDVEILCFSFLLLVVFFGKSNKVRNNV